MIWRHFSSLVLKIKFPKPQWIVVRRHQETGQNKTKSRAGIPKDTTRAEDNFIIHQFAWEKADCSKHHCTTKPMLRKKCQNPLWEMTLWNWPIWPNCCQKTTFEKAKQCQKAHKDWTREHWNKVLWTDELKFEIFGSNRRVYVVQVGERAATLWITPIIKHRRGSVFWGGGLPIAKSGIWIR